METQNSLVALAAISKSVQESLMETGELTPEIEAQLAITETELPAKVDQYAYVLDRLSLEGAFCRDKAAQWTKLARSFDAAEDRLKANIKFAMEQMNTFELVGGESKFLLSNSKPRMVIDEANLDKSYTMQVTATVADKERIRSELDMGLPVAGARLEPVKALRCSAAVSATKKQKSLKA